MNMTRMMTLAGLGLMLMAANSPAQPPMDPRFDANRDGRITREEVLALRESHFNQADLDKDGTLTPAEAAGLPHRGGGRGMGPRLAMLDANRDGRLSREEFLSFVPPWVTGMGGWRHPRAW